MKAQKRQNKAENATEKKQENKIDEDEKKLHQPWYPFKFLSCLLLIISFSNILIDYLLNIFMLESVVQYIT